MVYYCRLCEYKNEKFTYTCGFCGVYEFPYLEVAEEEDEYPEHKGDDGNEDIIAFMNSNSKEYKYYTCLHCGTPFEMKIKEICCGIFRCGGTKKEQLDYHLSKSDIDRLRKGGEILYGCGLPLQITKDGKNTLFIPRDSNGNLIYK